MASNGLRAAAIALGESVKYESGNGGILYDLARGEFYFSQSTPGYRSSIRSPRKIFGVDIVEWMIRQAAGDFVLPLQSELHPRGHAIEAPTLRGGSGARFPTSMGIVTGLAFHPMRGRNLGSSGALRLRPITIHCLRSWWSPAAIAMMRCRVFAAHWTRPQLGIESNLGYLREIAAAPFLPIWPATTASLVDLPYQPARVEIVAPWHAFELAGLAGAHRLLGCRCSALRTHGRSLASHRQPHSWKCRTRGEFGMHGLGTHFAVSQRHDDWL